MFGHILHCLHVLLYMATSLVTPVKYNPIQQLCHECYFYMVRIVQFFVETVKKGDVSILCLLLRS